MSKGKGEAFFCMGAPARFLKPPLELLEAAVLEPGLCHIPHALNGGALMITWCMSMHSCSKDFLAICAGTATSVLIIRRSSPCQAYQWFLVEMGRVRFLLFVQQDDNIHAAGVEDDGFPRGLTEADLEQSLTTLRAMAAEVHATATQVRALPGSSGRACAVLRVHRICRNEVSYVDLRIAGVAPAHALLGCVNPLCPLMAPGFLRSAAAFRLSSPDGSLLSGKQECLSFLFIAVARNSRGQCNKEKHSCSCHLNAFGIDSCCRSVNPAAQNQQRRGLPPLNKQ